ncbi:hypothetical protein V2H45_17190 [Tumidithrix elongata RA019]|uniref:Lipoprotein n=1 Tax=Tumidithrix elongata BACA0141 TaxID=2716417 RepID=A0AAW9Q5K3_9CYAN|nr:hypothetical protein [Tumidithrix elongata RA019]
MIGIKHFFAIVLLVICLGIGELSLDWTVPSWAETVPAPQFAEMSAEVSDGGATSGSTNPNQLVEGIDKIKVAMKKLRFCYNENCFYRQIESKIDPPSKVSDTYTATISALVDRPSANPNSADYHFAYVDDRWQLIKGEEYTDVADYVFDGDRYEIFSVHTNRVIRGNLAQAREEGNLKSGYIPLYFEILNNGVER